MATTKEKPSTNEGVDVKINRKPTTEKTCSCSKNDNTVVPVFTDSYGRIHVDKEFANEHPEIVNKLLDGEIERNKTRGFVTPVNYYPYGENTRLHPPYTVTCKGTNKSNLDDVITDIIDKLL